MSQPFGARRHRRRPHINLTSLIDVMFLLLIFFMVSSTFRHGFGLEVDLPSAETATETRITPEEIVVDERGNFYFAGKPVDEDGLRDGIVALLQDDPGATLILRADEAAGFGRAVKAIDIARSVGGSRLIIPTDRTPGASPPPTP
jgi:biopolymer transport protein ExbD